MSRNGVIGLAAAAVVVAGAIAYLQGFDAEKIVCEDIAAARVSLQAQYDAGVDASVQMYADARTAAQARLSQCLSAEPKDPCAAEQAARDAAYRAFFAIPSPADDAPYAEFQAYYAKRDEAYSAFKTAKAALDACRAANPLKEDVPYEESDTKACFDEYDASMGAAQSTFDADTQTMRAALKAAQVALDAREKACHPPTGDDKFTALQSGERESVVENILRCEPLNADADAELASLRAQAASLQAEIDAAETTIDNAQKRLRKLQSDLAAADTYIPPESTKTQFEGALNALRGQRKESIRSAMEYYENLIEKKEAQKARLQQELGDVQAKIAARLSEIQKENAERQSKYPTAVHLAKPEPDGCAYYHCHGTLCGISDPDPTHCGQGPTTQDDIDCKQFIKALMNAAGAQ